MNVAVRLGKGLSNRQISEEMGLSEKTIKNMVSTLLAKLGMTRRTQAAVLIAGELDHTVDPGYGSYRLSLFPDRVAEVTAALHCTSETPHRPAHGRRTGRGCPPAGRRPGRNLDRPDGPPPTAQPGIAAPGRLTRGSAALKETRPGIRSWRRSSTGATRRDLYVGCSRAPESMRGCAAYPRSSARFLTALMKSSRS